MTIDAYTTSGESQLFPKPISSIRAPTTLDIVASSGAPYLVGQLWVDTVSITIYGYAGAGNWIAL
jgi:hypothetical protein